MTDRELLGTWWSAAWNEGLWAAAWSRSVEDLTAAQAAWAPQPGRHSIWQIVLHMIFWREDCLRRLATGRKPTDEELAANNFPHLTDVSEPAWTAAKRRFADSQQRVAAVLADGAASLERVSYLLPHDCYHFGQINYLRAMQGLKPIE